MAITIDKDLPQPKLSPKIAPKKGTRPLKSTVARPLLAVNILARPALAPSALKATLKAAAKGVIGKKAPPKARRTLLKRPTRKINKR